MKRAPKNVFFFTNGAIGDFLMVLSLMEEVHAELKDSKLYIATSRNESLFREFTRVYPILKKTEIISVGTNNLKSILGLGRLLSFMFSFNYIMTPPTRGSIPVKLKFFIKLMSLRKKSLLVGFDDGAEVNKKIYDELIEIDDDVPFYDLLAGLLSKLGIGRSKKLPSIETVALEDIIEKYGLARNKYVILHPFASSNNKSILEDNLVWLVQEVSDASGLQVILTGGQQDYDRAEEIIKKLQRENVINFCGKAPIGDIVALVFGANFFVGVNTGITHVACLAQKRSFVISQYHPDNWLPHYNQNAIIVYLKGYPFQKLNPKEIEKETLMGVSREVVSKRFKAFLKLV